MTDAAATKTARKSNLTDAERKAYAEAMKAKGKEAARARHVAEGKKAARAKAIRGYYGKKAAVSKWKVGKMVDATMARRAGAGTVEEQVGGGQPAA